MKRGIIALMIVTLVVGMLLAACSSNEQVSSTGSAADASGKAGLVIKGGTDGTPTMPGNMAVHALHRYLEEYSDGKIQVNFYESRQLGGSEELLEQVMNGTIQFCLTGSSTMSFSSYRFC